MTKQSTVPVKDIKKILLINLAFIGDVILSTPVARALREHFFQASIDMLTVPVTAPIAELNPYIDRVIIYDKKGRHKKWQNLLNLLRELRSYRYDMIVCTNFAVRGAMIAWIVGAPCRIGYDAQHGKWFLTHAVSSDRPVIRHEADNYSDVLKALGITVADTSLKLKIRQQDQQAVSQILKRTDGKALVLICPAGSYPQKSWSRENYGILIEYLAEEADLVLIGGQAEKKLLEELNQASGGHAQVCGGTFTLPELTALIADSDLLITVDTAPLHIAQAIGTPVIALFGPTDPRVWGPRGEGNEVCYSKAACSPCWGKVRECDHRCMRGIRAQEVVEKARKILTTG